MQVYAGPYRNPARKNKRTDRPVATNSDQGADGVNANHVEIGNDDDDDDGDSLDPVNLERLCVGLYVAVDKPEWTNRPLIGKVESIGDSKVKIHWVDGSYNGTFRDSYVGSGVSRKPWTEEIEMNYIVMIGVQFTKSRRIRKEDIEELKARYQMFDEENERDSD